jgi:hypothetical protein
MGPSSWPERVCVIAYFVASGTVGLFHSHPAEVLACLMVMAAAVVVGLAFFGRRKLYERRHPDLQPEKPNYNRTPYV